MNGLSGKLAVVTGGATGIGAGVTGVLLREGARVAVIQRNPRRLADLPDGALGFQADLMDADTLTRVVESITQDCGPITVLVNNSSVTGTAAIAPFLDTSRRHLDEIVDANLKGTFLLSQLVARHMVELGIRGSIICVSSVGAYAAQEAAAIYCATNAAQVALTRGMALELAPYGIRVNAVAPGDVNTGASADIASDVVRSGASGRYLRLTPLGRRGSPEEIGEAVAFLASDRASFITGATLLVDGGFLAY